MSSVTRRADGGKIANDIPVRPMGSVLSDFLPKWKFETLVDAELVVRIHKYLNVMEFVYAGIIESIAVIDLLQKLVEKEQKSNGMQSLTRRSLCVCILSLPHMLTQLEHVRVHT